MRAKAHLSGQRFLQKWYVSVLHLLLSSINLQLKVWVHTLLQHHQIQERCAVLSKTPAERNGCDVGVTLGEDIHLSAQRWFKINVTTSIVNVLKLRYLTLCNEQPPCMPILGSKQRILDFQIVKPLFLIDRITNWRNTKLKICTIDSYLYRVKH